MEDYALTLETLINRATDPGNGTAETSAAVEFANVIIKHPNYAHVAARLIALKIQSAVEWEAMQGLNVLDSCMKRCGSAFQSEVGKFRFLNEMIKLVSPKYLGNMTSSAVRRKVLHMMYIWTLDYSRETKIKEAYEMLRKQGVVKEEPVVYISSQDDDESNTPLPPRSKNTIFEDEERSRLLQKLLQSKNPDDIQAANRLIKSMVKEDERRVEVNSRRITELESVHNNARLLSEMLDSYKPGVSSPEDLELIKELHQSCERLRPNVFRLASETQDNEAMLNEVLSASDELGQVFDKYTAIILLGKRDAFAPVKPAAAAASLLDLSTPSEEKLPPVAVDLLKSQLDGLDFAAPTAPAPPDQVPTPPPVSPVKQSNYEVLGDIFASIQTTASVDPSPDPLSMLQPTSAHHPNSLKAVGADFAQVQEKNSKLKALDDLDSMGESMLLQNLPNAVKLGSQFSKSSTKIPMNLMSKPQSPEAPEAQNPPKASMDLDFLIGGAVKAAAAPSFSESVNGDDSMVDLSEDSEIYTEVTLGPKAVESVSNSQTPPNLPTQLEKNSLPSEVSHTKKEDSVINMTNKDGHPCQERGDNGTPIKRVEVKPLTDIFVSIESISPGTIPPLPVLEERNGISVILHFAKDTPRPDVSVIVVTTISKNASKLSNYLLQAVVPKSCKLRLLPPSSSELPAHSPFLPPSAITQVMLIANPNKDKISLKFILSYTMDEETVTEMGDVEQLPMQA